MLLIDNVVCSLKVRWSPACEALLRLSADILTTKRTVESVQ